MKHQTEQKLKLNAFGGFARRCRFSRKKATERRAPVAKSDCSSCYRLLLYRQCRGRDHWALEKQKVERKKYKGLGIKIRKEKEINEGRDGPVLGIASSYCSRRFDFLKVWGSCKWSIESEGHLYFIHELVFNWTRSFVMDKTSSSYTP